MILEKKKKLIWTLIFCLGVFLIIFGLTYLNKRRSESLIDRSPFRDSQGRLVVTTSLFPIYDFAKIVGGDKTVVSLILPPGSEAHAFLPQAKDLELIKNSALFFYTSDLMEKWANALSYNLSARNKIVPVASGLNDASLDPHVWLDFSKASLMVDVIAKNYEALDPQNAAYYQANAEAYKEKLSNLDNLFKTSLANCQFKEIISGGHYTFGYLAKHYNLKYQAVQGFVPDKNVDAEKILMLSQELKTSGAPSVYYEEMIIPQLAELLRQESGVSLMPLNAAHNVGRYDIESGVTFIRLMENDLSILKIGLKCQP
ncbi:MAG: zinc ABC transporter substrate-binding protein [Candidatus Falkowbacteria bacterium]